MVFPPYMLVDEVGRPLNLDSMKLLKLLTLIGFTLMFSGSDSDPWNIQIWEESVGENLLQIQLLAALRSFVCSLGYQSSICYNMLLPILQSGIDINNPHTLSLLEDSVLVSCSIDFNAFK